MTFRPLTALALCLALVSPGAAQVRAVTSISRAPSGMPVVPVLGAVGGGIFSPSLALPSAPAALLAAPAPSLSALAPAALQAAPAVAATVRTEAVATPLSALRAVAVPQAAASDAVAASRPAASAQPVSAASVRQEGEKFWSQAADASELDADIPAVSAAASRTRTALLRGAGLAPVAAALPALPHWASVAAPYAGGAAALAGAYGLIRVTRWGIDKLAARLGWDKNAVVLARFASSVVLWTAGAGVGLGMAGVSGTALLATFGAGGTAMALAITLAVRDVAGNLFHGVHFLLSRPYTIGDKVTIGKITGVVHDLTLRYLVLQDETGGFILFTYNKVSSSPVTLYSEYHTKESRLRLRKPVFPRGFVRALRDAVAPTLWKPILFSALAIAALSFLPLLPVFVKGTAVSWLAVALPYLKAAVVAVLAASLSRSFKAAIERLAARYGWARPATTVAKLGATVLTWVVGGSFLLNAVGVSWAWVAGTLSLSTVLVSIAVNDYVSAVFQGSMILALKPFQIGDRVTIGDAAGTVVDITLQYVVLKLDAEGFMLIPHSVVKDSAIVTPREYGQRRK